MTDIQNAPSPLPWDGQPYSIKRHGISITNCASEPVQTPGCVQGHGALLVLNPADLTVVQASENVASLLGRSLNDLLGQPVAVAVGIEGETVIRGLLRDELVERTPRFALILPPRGKEDPPLCVTVHTMDGVALVEFEGMDMDTLDAADYFSLVREVCTQLQSTNDLADFCSVAAEEIRALTGFDRVMVYKFHEDFHGEVFAESKRPDLSSWLGLHYPAEDIPEPARAIFRKIWQRPTPDVDGSLAELVPLLNPLTKKPLDMTYCALRGASIMYTEYLKNIKVTAGYTLSLRRGENLWGLIACHHYSGVKHLPFKLRAACEFLAQIVSLQHRAVEDREHLLYRKELESSTSQLIAAVNTGKDLSVAIEMTPTLLDCMNATGVAFFYLNRWWLLGKTPTESELGGIRTWLFAQPTFNLLARPVYATDCLSRAYPPALAFPEVASGILAVPLSKDKQSLIIWFRPEFIHTVKWAGNPHDKPAILGPHGPRLTPRRSFEIFVESVRFRSRPWRDVELDASDHLRHFLALEDAKRDADTANAAKTQFLTNMSHEIRTPLNAIIGFAEILTGSEGTKADQKLYLETILRNGRALAGIIDDILDLAKVEAAKLDIQPVVTDYFAVLADVERTLAYQASCKGLRIRHEYLGHLPESIVSDSTRLRQILMNVVGNAVKFSSTGEILISVAIEARSGQPDRLTFSVKDQGEGITVEQQQQLFQPFTQANNSITRRFGGTGLGLVLSRQLSRLLGGDLTLATSEPGKGSTFVVKIDMDMIGGRSPSNTMTNIPALNSQLEVGSDSLKGRRVLVAEDSPDNRLLIKAILATRGLIVDFAEDGLEAITKAVTAEYDIVLMDIQMPRCDGLEATRVLRRRGYGKPIIALTANAMKAAKDSSLAAGCNSHLSKPISQKELIRAITIALAAC